jgi:hypothetical protein
MAAARRARQDIAEGLAEPLDVNQLYMASAVILPAAPKILEASQSHT